MLNVPLYLDYTQAEKFQSKDVLGTFVKKMALEELDMAEAQKKLSEELKMPLAEDTVPILMKFYKSANRKPLFNYSCGSDAPGGCYEGNGTLF